MREVSCEVLPSSFQLHFQTTPPPPVARNPKPTVFRTAGLHIQVRPPPKGPNPRTRKLLNPGLRASGLARSTATMGPRSGLLRRKKCGRVVGLQNPQVNLQASHTHTHIQTTCRLKTSSSSLVLERSHLQAPAEYLKCSIYSLPHGPSRSAVAETQGRRASYEDVGPRVIPPSCSESKSTFV